jgi:hypothetical protein
MMRSIVLLLASAALFYGAHAQSLSLINATTVCSVADNTECTYTVNVLPAATFTSPATEGVTNKMICVTDLGATFTRVPNPVLSVDFVDTVAQALTLPAPCECESIVWYIADSIIEFDNTNVNAVLNECGVCGAAVGNNACNGDAEDMCFGAPTCNALTGQCDRADKCAPSGPCFVKGCASPLTGCNLETPKCDDRRSSCLVGTCNPTTYECAYDSLDFTIPGCVPEVGGIVKSVNTLPSTSDLHVELHTSQDVDGFSSSGGLTQTNTDDIVVSVSGELEDETIHETSDSSYHKGGLTDANIAIIMIVPPLATLTVASALGFLVIGSL